MYASEDVKLNAAILLRSYVEYYQDCDDAYYDRKGTFHSEVEILFSFDLFLINSLTPRQLAFAGKNIRAYLLMSFISPTLENSS